MLITEDRGGNSAKSSKERTDVPRVIHLDIAEELTKARSEEASSWSYSNMKFPT